jgi:hypothetical protein
MERNGKSASFARVVCHRLLLGLLLLGVFTASGAGGSHPPGHELFSDAEVRHFKIDIAPLELEKLRRDHKTYVRATVTVGEQTFRDCGVRLKGEGSFRPLDDKPSFAMNFDEFEPGQRYSGLDKVMLNTSRNAFAPALIAMPACPRPASRSRASPSMAVTSASTFLSRP